MAGVKSTCPEAKSHVVLVAAQLVGGMAQDAWGLRHQRL